ncbi:hypothetical protein PM082_023857 [Marasmius tenuissimus]|nr:hypothetical protein PM082_023857 [Marasmius tenuissimus]
MNICWFEVTSRRQPRTRPAKDQLQPKAKRQRKRKLPFGKKPIETDSGIPTALVSTERACSRAQTQTDPTRTISTAPSESKLNFVGTSTEDTPTLPVQPDP